jgi:hypothetical protein
MSGHETILGHLVTWGLSQRYEDAATEGLAFLLRSDGQLRQQFVALLQAAQPGLPGNLHFTTQETFDGCRLDMCGRTDNGAPVFIENKFWAALTGNQPVAYLERLARQQIPSLLVFIVPEQRRTSLWHELLSRLAVEGVAHKEVGAHLVEIVGKPHSQRLHMSSWTAVFKALEGGDERARANLEQLKGVCHAAKEADLTPLVQEELIDTRVPARLMQYTNIVINVVEAGCPGVFPAASRDRHKCWWHGYGQRIHFAWDPPLSAWLGVGLNNWHKYAAGPLWLYFSKEYGQTPDIETRLHTWANLDGKRLLREDNEGLALHLPLRVGCELHTVTEDVIAQIRAIGDVLRPAPASPAAP